MGKRITLEERFWKHVLFGDTCWEWVGCLYEGGYGMIRVDNRNRRAHRIAWLLTYGEIPAGQLVCHKCDNPPCVRPSHLFLGTDADNMRDKRLKGRARWHRGHANGMAKLTDALVSDIRNGSVSGLSYRALARVYGLHYTTVGEIVRRKIWAHLP
jgi:hypothetical protein